MTETDLSVRLRDVPTSSAATILAGLGVRRVVLGGVRRIAGAGALCGRARTLRFLPKREDVAGSRGNVQRRTIDTLRSGEVLVVDALGFLHGAVLGDMLGARAKALGAAGVVVDGVVRDAAALAGLELAVFARGTYPEAWQSSLISWEADVPIQCGGTLVEPGDYVLADDDAVLVVPPAHAAEVAARGAEMNARDALSQRLIASGLPLDDAYPLPETRIAELER